MECVSLPERSSRKTAKSTLAFSIDKIIGLQDNVKDEDKTPNSVPDSEKLSTFYDKHLLTNQAKNTERDTFEKPINKLGSTESSDKHIFHKKLDENFKQLKLDKYGTPVSPTATGVYDTHIQPQNIVSAHGREIQDINMNLMSYLHPAFLLGRLNPEDYRAHLLHNYYLQHQNTHLSKEASYALDLYKLGNPQYFNAQATQDLQKQILAENLHLNEHLPSSEDDLKHKHKVELKEAGFATAKDRESTTKDLGSEPVKDYREPYSDTRDKKFQNKAQKTFTCQECGKMFNAHYNLTRHMPVHTGSYIIPLHCVKVV